MSELFAYVNEEHIEFATERKLFLGILVSDKFSHAVRISIVNNDDWLMVEHNVQINFYEFHNKYLFLGHTHEWPVSIRDRRQNR